MFWRLGDDLGTVVEMKRGGKRRLKKKKKDGGVCFIFFFWGYFWWGGVFLSFLCSFLKLVY